MSFTCFCKRNDREIGALVLGLVQVRAVEAADAIDGEAQRRLTGVVGDLEVSRRTPPRIMLIRVFGSMMPDT